jgi:hypothetical protein
MVITVYVLLFFTLPSFSLVKLWENKLDRKVYPKNGEIIRPVRKNVILTVRELPFRLSYRLFGSLIIADNEYFTKVS